MTNIPEDLRELYVEFGQAAEMAQVMEVEAGNLALSFVTIAFDTTNITDEQREFFRALVDDVDKRTFGNLMKEIRKTTKVSEAIDETINEALAKRNYLIHKFFRTHNFAINSEEGRKAMRAELAAIHASLSRAHITLHGMTNTLNQAFGKPNISEEDAQQFVVAAKKLEI
ncbi:MAG: hypothetical protein QOH71_4434 [Blastocatellia bacterium]|jgi:hypothetical protein|nr:hypothetical protein [Blastocatellia bacterium]